MATTSGADGECVGLVQVLVTSIMECKLELGEWFWENGTNACVILHTHSPMVPAMQGKLLFVLNKRTVPTARLGA